MKREDSNMRRTLLRPLVRRQTVPTSVRRVEAAFRALEERAIADALLPEMVDEQKEERLKTSRGRWQDPDSARSRIRFAAAMYLARRISFQQYTFLVANAVEGVHDARTVNGEYPELQRLSAIMRKIEIAHGLASDEYWPIKDAPPKYRAANVKWDIAAERLLGEAFDELEGSVAAKQFRENRLEFDRLRERGRRAFFHNNELIHALADTIKRYECEANACAAAEAFTAAVTLLGASVEGLLLLRCLRSKVKARKVAGAFPAKNRPRDLDSPVRWSFDNLIQVCLLAGWLPVIDTPTLAVRPDGLAHILRDMRNLIHPGRVCAHRPWIEAERRDFEDAESIYTTLFATMFKGAALKRYSESVQPGI